MKVKFKLVLIFVICIVGFTVIKKPVNFLDYQNLENMISIEEIKTDDY